MGKVLLTPAGVLIALVLLVLCWRDGEVRVRTKLCLTALYCASWLFVFLEGNTFFGLFFCLSQWTLAGIFGFLIYGLELFKK
jgi:hypothetical protein